MQVVVVDDQKAETLVRSLLACLVAVGGSPREWVLDNPRTVRISPIGKQRVVLHRFLRQAVAEYRVIPALCAPRSGNRGAPATLLVRRHHIDIHVGDTHCRHDRDDGTGEVRRLPEHRQEVLAALHPRRKTATFRRQCLLEPGQSAWQFRGRLVHECPDGRWEKPCSDLYDL